MTTRKLTPKQLAKQQERLVEQIYYQNCQGMQIDVMKIGRLFTMAGKMLDEGAKLEAIVAMMWGFAENPEVKAGVS